MPSPAPVHSQITFLYYSDLKPIAEFFETVLGFDLVEDQGFARIYRTGGNAYVGIVDGAQGWHRPQERSAVLVTLAVADVDAWHAHLLRHGVTVLREPATYASIGVRCFFFADPGGYHYEIQEFLRPEARAVFHGG